MSAKASLLKLVYPYWNGEIPKLGVIEIDRRSYELLQGIR